MIDIEVIKVEEQSNRRLIFRACARATAGQLEFPIAVQDQGSTVLNETAALRSMLGFAEEIATSLRLRLGLARTGQL